MRAFALCFLLLPACSSSSNEASPAAADAGSEAAVETGEAPLGVLSWTTGPLLGSARDHHATVLLDGRIRVFGGIQNNTTLLSSNESAELTDGVLGEWTAEPPLPEGMAGHGMAVVGNTVILSGGRRGATLGIVARTDVGPGTWTSGPSMSVARFHHGSIAVGDDVFFVGGLTGAGKDSTPSVEVAHVTDGKLGAMRETTPLPERRSHHSLARVGNTIYASGGLAGDPSGTPSTYDDVLRADVDASGNLGAWSVAGKLAVTVATHASFTHGGFLYVVGGVENNATDSAAVRRAPFNADGTLGAWESLTPMPKGLAHCHQVVLSGRKLFVVGGAQHHASSRQVFIGTFE